MPELSHARRIHFPDGLRQFAVSWLIDLLFTLLACCNKNGGTHGASSHYSVVTTHTNRTRFCPPQGWRQIGYRQAQNPQK